jgi:uncharacterized membrane protein
MTTIILLRLIHILSAILWVGTAIFINVLLFPSLRGEPATMGKVANILAAKGMHKYLGLSAILTLLSGFSLVWIMSNGDLGAYSRGPGRVFTMAGGLATIAFLLGMMIARPMGLKMGELGGKLGATTDAAEKGRLTAEMAALQKKSAIVTMLVVGLLILAACGMAVARYV